MTFFFHRAGRVKPRAAALVPKSLTLARAPIGWGVVFPEWCSRRRGHLLTGRISRAGVQALNDGLRGRIDFMTAHGWR